MPERMWHYGKQDPDEQPGPDDLAVEPTPAPPTVKVGGWTYPVDPSSEGDHAQELRGIRNLRGRV